MTNPNEPFKRAANSPAGRQAAETIQSVADDVSDFANGIFLVRRASNLPGAQDIAGDVYDNTHVRSGETR